MVKQYSTEDNQKKLVNLLGKHQKGMTHQPNLKNSTLSLAFIDDINGYLGGVLAKQTGNRFHISLLAVDEALRGKKIGSQLLIEVEAYAKREACRYLTVNTQDFQAVSFYQKHGFTIFGELEDCPFEGTTKFFLKKAI